MLGSEIYEHSRDERFEERAVEMEAAHERVHAECHSVDKGKITHITIIFDRQPFTEARAAAGSA